MEIDAANVSDHIFSPSVSPVNGAVFAIHRFKLDPLISEIKLLFYHLPSRVNAYVWPSDEQTSQAIVGQKLEAWLDMLNNTVASSQVDDDEQQEHEKYKLKLTSQYYAAMVLLHQPSQAIPQPSEQSILTCYECAAKRLDIYHNLYQLDSYFQSWRSVQGIFSSGATMIYCLWSSSLVRHTIPSSVAMCDLRTCTNLLSVGGEFWPSVKKGKESFSRAMDALAYKLDQLHHEENQHYGSSHGPQPKFGRNARSRIVTQDENAYHLLADQVDTDQSHTATQEQEEHVDFVPSTFDMASSDWSTFGDATSVYDTTYHPGAMFGATQEAPDATVEAFIAEFLNNDTAWNPF